jgi:hypothetical protein
VNASRDGLLTVNNGLLIIRGPPAVNNHVNNARNNYTPRPNQGHQFEFRATTSYKLNTTVPRYSQELTVCSVTEISNYRKRRFLKDNNYSESLTKTLLMIET